MAGAPVRGLELERGGRAAEASLSLQSLSSSYLAMLPLFAAYEWGLATAGGARNSAELLLGWGLRPLGERAALVRWALLGVLALAALAAVRLRGARARGPCARIVLEGLAFALLLGPLLVVALAAFGDLLPRLDVSWDPTGSPPSLAQAALLAGGAAWEEVLFRVGLYGALYLLARRTALALGSSDALAGWSGDALGLAGSSLVFAAAHLERFTRWLGPGGASPDPALFAWLALAGAVLGLVFRLRGPGVAAWAHGLFNLALWIGIDPDVIL